MKPPIPLVCILVTFLTGCARLDPLRGFVGSYRSYTEIKGNIKDDMNKKEGTGVVAFGDDFGLQLMVHWFEAPTNVNLVSDSVLLEQTAAFMEETAKKTFPKVTIGTKKLGVADQSTLFYMAVAEAPGVKVYIPPAQRKTVTKEMVMPHIFRGHLVVRRGGWVYALMTQTEAEFGTDKAKITEQQEAEVESKLEKFLADFEFK